MLHEISVHQRSPKGHLEEKLPAVLEAIAAEKATVMENIEVAG